MDGDTWYPIGELARRTGLTVKAIRFYADRGLVPPTARTAAGHRLYDARAAARLELLVTLRELGLDLATIRRVLDHEVSLAEVVAAHADALAVQIRILRLRQVVLASASRRGATPEEMDMVHKLARLTADERGRLVGDFLDAVFGPVAADPAFAGIARSLTPELPDDPAAEQIEAWVEWAEMSRDPGFRAALARTAAGLAADRAAAGDTGVRRDAVALVCAAAAPAVAAGLDPRSPEAGATVAAVTARYAGDCGLPDGEGIRRRLLDRLTAAGDPRRERHLRLLSVINGWPAPAGAAPVLDWFVRALRAGPAAADSRTAILEIR